MPANTINIGIEGVNGDYFPLYGRGQGTRGVHLGEDLKGILDAPVLTIQNTTAFQIGATYGGMRWLMREVEFTAHVLEGAGNTLEGNDSAWRRAWGRYDRDAKLWFETETARRWLKLRPMQAPNTDLPRDPVRAGHISYRMKCVALDPWWYEPTVTTSFIATIDTTGGGTELGEVPAWNPTDTDLWFEWVAQGEAGIEWTLPDHSFGDNRHGRAVEDADRMLPAPALLQGEHLVINTDELSKDPQMNSSLDTEIYLRANGIQFLYPMPPHTGTESDPVMLPVAVTGAPAGAGLQLRCKRPYSRPMGMQ